VVFPCETVDAADGLAVITIRRLVDRQQAYTGIFLPGMEPKIFPTSDYEHARILQIYKQDRPYEGIENDFSEMALGRDWLPAKRSR
jgi:hypothetical protein